MLAKQWTALPPIAVIAAAFAAANACAQAWKPDKPVEIVVGTSAGGPQDRMGRALVQFWDAALAKMVKSDEWQKELADHRLENIYINSVETAKHWKTEYDEVRAVLMEMGLAK